MSIGSYRFKLGDFECVSLSDGGWDYQLKNLFAKVPVERLQETLCQDDLSLGYVTTPYTHLYVNTGERRVLVDMGAGELLAPRTGKLLHSMRTVGIGPAQIDTVIITHAHPDHIGGALDNEGRPVYARASYYISKDEWEFWFSEVSMVEAQKQHADIARRHLEPIRDRVNFVDGASEIVPGIRAIPAPGHTPGHMVVELSSVDVVLLYTGDAALHPLHLEHPSWLPIYDILPEEATITKRWIFDRAAAEKALVIGPHFPPFPSLGTVVTKGEGWQWHPIMMTADQKPQDSCTRVRGCYRRIARAVSDKKAEDKFLIRRSMVHQTIQDAAAELLSREGLSMLIARTA